MALGEATAGLRKGRSRRRRSLPVLPCVTTDLVAGSVRHRPGGSGRFPVINGELTVNASKPTAATTTVHIVGRPWMQPGCSVRCTELTLNVSPETSPFTQSTKYRATSAAGVPAFSSSAPLANPRGGVIASALPHARHGPSRQACRRASCPSAHRHPRTHHCRPKSQSVVKPLMKRRRPLHSVN